MIRSGVHIHGDGVLIPPWAAWQLEQRLPLSKLRRDVWLEDIKFLEVLNDLRAVALQGPEQLSSEPGTRVAASRNPSETMEMSVSDVAAKCGLSDRGVRKAAMSGRLHGEKRGARGDWVFSSTAVDEFERSRRG